MNWLELRSGAPGLSGPVLVEHTTAYEILGGPTFYPQLVLTLGGKTQQQILRFQKSSRHQIHFHPTATSTLLLDCDMHNVRSLPRIIPGQNPATAREHFLQSQKADSASQAYSALAYSIYWDTLMSFTSLIVLFLDDLGTPLRLTQLVNYWVRKAAAQPLPCPPHLVIYLPNNMPQVEIRLLRSFLDSHSVRKCFGDIYTIPVLDFSFTDLYNHATRAFAARQKAGMGFHNHHLRFFLQQAILDTASGKATDVYATARLRNPVPASLSYHIGTFIELTNGTDIEQEVVVASALELNAHPPGMHYFPPEETFEQYYGRTLRDTVYKSLVPNVKRHFVKFSQERRDSASARCHLHLLSRYGIMWQSRSSNHTCLVCLVDRPDRSVKHLPCGHGLCRSCFILCSSSLACDRATRKIQQCPLCGERIEKEIVLTPPTAGLRVLELKGSACTKYGHYKFLKAFQRIVGLPQFPLREHFDMVIASGIGIYFAQTLFVEGWALADCHYHLANVGDPKLSSSTISFGKRLSWDLSNPAASGGAAFQYFTEKRFFTNQRREPHSPERRRDLTIRFEGGWYDPISLQSIGNRVLSSLLYIELDYAPQFYKVPDVARIRLRCRVSGAPLLSLVLGLFYANAEVLFGTLGQEQSAGPLVTPFCLAQCRKGAEFSRCLTIDVISLDSVVDVRLRKDGACENISNCPYALRQLIEDQGLNSAFGRRDHQSQDAPFAPFDEIQEDIDRLCEVLDKVE